MYMTMWRLAESDMLEVRADKTRGEKLAATFVPAPMSAEAWAHIEARLPTMDPAQREMLEQQHRRSEDPKVLVVGAAWHLAHYLLCGDNAMVPALPGADPLQLVVYGGMETDYRVSDFGPGLTLDANDVSACAAALYKLPDALIRQRADPAILNRMNIYPNPTPGGWDDRQLSMIWPFFLRLSSFYSEAANHKDGIFKVIV